jgi:hypothetical protein
MGFKHLASQREQRVRFRPARSAGSPPSAGAPRVDQWGRRQKAPGCITAHFS